MKCPRDGTELAKVEILGLELDKCHKCDGLWFDRGELERIRDAEVPEIEEVLEEKYGDPEVTEGEVEGYMRCPRCGGRLQRQHYTYVRPVRVDRCEKCLGLWLDKGERLKILKDKKLVDAIDIGPEETGRQHDEIRQIDCPRCGVPMHHVADRAQKHIGFEICRKCQGSFLDAGELRDLSEFTILERIKALFGH